jgi:glucose dehydrogenase
MRNWKTLLGTVVALSGLFLIGYNGYLKVSGRSVEVNFLLAGLLLCLTGAYLIKRGRTD